MDKAWVYAWPLKDLDRAPIDVGRLIQLIPVMWIGIVLKLSLKKLWLRLFGVWTL